MRVAFAVLDHGNDVTWTHQRRLVAPRVRFEFAHAQETCRVEEASDSSRVSVEQIPVTLLVAIVEPPENQDLVPVIIGGHSCGFTRADLVLICQDK